MHSCYSSKCLFVCDELTLATGNMKFAVELVKDGRYVDFYYDDNYVGALVFAGEVDTIAEIPNGNSGEVFHCKEDDGFYISIPDEFLRPAEESVIVALTYSEAVV